AAQRRNRTAGSRRDRLALPALGRYRAGLSRPVITGCVTRTTDLVATVTQTVITASGRDRCSMDRAGCRGMFEPM
ncbi:MAG: hypothetical protein ACRDRF_24590, partial [Pseudonocardiaceae bacterium]